MHPFGHSSLNYQTLAGGAAPDNWTPAGNMPGGPAVQLVAGMLGDSWSQQAGLANFGYQSHQNTYDLMRQKAMFNRNKQVLQAAAQGDRASFEATMTGAFKMAGVDMTDPARQAEVQKMSAMAASMGGHFATMAPELYDSMHGPRGSAVVMANSMMQAGRYQIDPVTGRVGMSGQSLADQSFLVHQQLFSGDNYLQMKGVRAGEAGRMHDELVRRGMAPQPLSGQSLTRGALAQMSAVGTLESAYSAAGIKAGTDIRDLTPSQVQQLDGTQMVKDARSDPSVIAAANAKQTADKLKDWSGAVSAMKEIFGDSGHPNAPMAEIINALEQMTAGNMQQFSSGRVEGIVRKMKNLAYTSGMTMEGTMQMMQGVQRMQQGVGFGNNSSAFAADITMSSMAFRSSLNLSQPQWGLSSADQLASTDAQLREQARGSVYANHLGVLARLGTSTGAFAGEQGADARELIAAMSGPNRNNKHIAELMKKHGIQSESGLMDFINKQSGGAVGAGQVATLLADRFGTQEYVNKFRLQDPVRNMQFDAEVKPFIQDSYAGAFYEKLDRAGSDAAGDVMMRALSAMKEDGYNVGSSGQRSAYVAKSLAEAAKTNPALAGLKGKSLAELEAMVETAWAAGSRDSMNEFGLSQADMFTVQDQATLEQGENRQMTAERDAIMQSAMAGHGKGTMLEKAIGVFQQYQGLKPDELKKKVSEALGGVDPEKLGPMMQALGQYQKDLNSLESSDEYKAATAELASLDQQISAASGDPAKRKELEEKRAALMSGAGGRFMRLGEKLRGDIEQINAMGEAAGVDLSGPGAAELVKPDGSQQTVKLEVPKDGMKIAGTITIEDKREPTVTGTLSNAGDAPNPAQMGPMT